MTNLEMLKNLVPDPNNELFTDEQYKAFLSIGNLNADDLYENDKQTDIMLCLADVCDAIDRKKHQLVRSYTKGQISKTFLETDWKEHARMIRMRYRIVK